MSGQSDDIEFGLFDPSRHTDFSRRNLPHWFQPNVAVFLTFRTADSLPRNVVQKWQHEQRLWLRENGVPLSDSEPLPQLDALPNSIQPKFRSHKDRRWHMHLDDCHGACLLQKPTVAQTVADSLLHFNGERYDLDSFVIMPNHVHVLVQFRESTTCRQQAASWLRFSAREINRSLGRKGPFWQSEPFDHLVRSTSQFVYLRKYIQDNPQKAKLPQESFLLVSRLE